MVHKSWQDSGLGMHLAETAILATMTQGWGLQVAAFQTWTSHSYFLLFLSCPVDKR